VASVSLNVALDFILIPKIGIVGGAIGSDAAFALYVPAHYWICRSMTGLPLTPLLMSTARVCIAAAAMAGVLFAFGTDHLSVGAWVLGSIGGTIAYVAVLVTSRETSLAELRGLGGDVARRLRRTPGDLSAGSD
jgi:peptidoglycan biosynthesis protein MviN/MurJ (putative lipid II flippase)